MSPGVVEPWANCRWLSSAIWAAPTTAEPSRDYCSGDAGGGVWFPSPIDSCSESAGASGVVPQSHPKRRREQVNPKKSWFGMGKRPRKKVRLGQSRRWSQVTPVRHPTLLPRWRGESQASRVGSKGGRLPPMSAFPRFVVGILVATLSAGCGGAVSELGNGTGSGGAGTGGAGLLGGGAGSAGGASSPSGAVGGSGVIWLAAGGASSQVDSGAPRDCQLLATTGETVCAPEVAGYFYDPSTGQCQATGTVPCVPTSVQNSLERCERLCNVKPSDESCPPSENGIAGLACETEGAYCIYDMTGCLCDEVGSSAWFCLSHDERCASAATAPPAGIECSGETCASRQAIVVVPNVECLCANGVWSCAQ